MGYLRGWIDLDDRLRGNGIAAGAVLRKSLRHAGRGRDVASDLHIRNLNDPYSSPEASYAVHGCVRQRGCRPRRIYGRSNSAGLERLGITSLADTAVNRI